MSSPSWSERLFCGFRKTSERLVHEGYIVSLFEAEFEGPGGEPISRDVIRHPGAVAVVAVTASTARPPVSSAVTSRFGQSAVSRRTKLNAMASIVARNTARNGVIPDNSSATIAMSGRKW